MRKQEKTKQFDPIYYFAILSSLPHESFGEDFFDHMAGECKDPGSFEFFLAQWPHSSLEDVSRWFIDCTQGQGAFANFGENPKERMLKLMKMLQLYWHKYRHVPKDHWRQQQVLWIENNVGNVADGAHFLKMLHKLNDENRRPEKQIWREYDRKK